jgi:Metallo-beta-lactamase superfamily.
MRFYILASGSEGNCSALVNKENEVLLIDCGIAFQKIKERLNLVGLDISMVKKVLITHTYRPCSI